MELKILEETKKKIVLKIEGTGHSFCNALVEEVWKDEEVDIASYTIRHPLVGVPELVVEMKSGDPKKALIDAAKRLEKANEKLRSEFVKELK
jgi:DNA-directed RNA polymerase subunit L